MRYCRNAQPRFFHKKLLQTVQSTHPFFGIDRTRAKRACDLADAQPEHFLYIVRSRSLAEGIGADPVIAIGG